MLKWILLIAFFGISALSIFGWLEVSMDAIAGTEAVIEKKGLAAKIVVPEGMEVQYKKALDAVKNTTELASEQAANFVGRKDEIAQNSTPTEQAQKFISGEAKNERIMNKIDSWIIQNNKMVIDVRLFNNTEGDISERVQLKCQAFVGEQPVDFFTWEGFVKIPSKKLVKIKGANLGFVNAQNVTKVECNI